MRPGIDYVGITTIFFCHDGKGNFLFHKRSDKCRDEHGRWDTGSGKLEHGLTLRENVLKEIEEEYGCVGVIDEELPPLDIFREHNGEKTHWLAVPFLYALILPRQNATNQKRWMSSAGFVWAHSQTLSTKDFVFNSKHLNLISKNILENNKLLSVLVS